MPSRPCSQAAASHSIWSRGKAPYKSKTRADRGREREVAKQCRCLPCEHTHFITLFGLFTSLDCRVVSSFSALTPFPSLSLSLSRLSVLVFDVLTILLPIELMTPTKSVKMEEELRTAGYSSLLSGWVCENTNFLATIGS